MRKTRCLTITLAILTILVAPLGACAAAPAPRAGSGADEGIIIRTLPGIVVDTEANEVRLKGEVCLQTGTLELFACSEGTREHESVVAVKARPSDVTFALALLGLDPGQPGFLTEARVFSPPAGAVLDITVRFPIETREGAETKKPAREVPAWKMLRLAGSKTALGRPMDWVYVGQPSEEALKAADREGTVVCLSNFVEAVIDIPFESTSVNANLLYEANPDVVPPVGTPVELVIRPTGKRIPPKKVQTEVVLKRGEPPILDGEPTDLKSLGEAVIAMPASVRAAILRADPDERFGRVMEIAQVLEDALLRVRLMVLKPTEATPTEAKPPLQITVTADDHIRIGQDRLSLDAFKTRAAELLADVDRVSLIAEPKASYETVVELLNVLREHEVSARLRMGKAGEGEPAAGGGAKTE